MAKILIEIPDNVNYKNYDMPYFVLDAITSGKPIPDNATNGDMIKAMFPNVEFKKDHEFTVWGYINNGDCIVRYDIDWWNAPYEVEE